ncbi:piggyBac transposable element-derived protein 4-like isoform X1 [Gymnodraco acuticeps]|uniref:PiggyBac transposable element-derived protein 4-like isoform X1 n=1 Tax=Gymnodraco acuticeps TaxID=8218 RepID=A0A6P8T9J9_GYMAC|nr:piggyBac transposable element-derived protein 4-like isoform X1 [Gymnodraco acuticeps]
MCSLAGWSFHSCDTQQASKMKRRFSVEEARDMVMQPATSSELLDSSSESETTSEEECDVEFVVESDPSSSDPSAETAEETEDSGSGWTSKNGEIWSPSNNDTLRYIPAARGLVPGPTRYAITIIDDVESSFNLFFTAEIISSIVDMTNLQGGRSVANWSDVDATDIRAYIGLLILAGVYKSKGESTRSLWVDHSGRAIFRATMTHTKFRLMNTTLRFDDKLMRPSRHREDKLAPIRSLWEKWTHRLPMLFNPGEDVCVDEQLVPFRGRCKFRQYIPSKPAKYGLKIWVTADVETSYAWKCQIYTGKAAGSAAEVGQGKRVVLEMTEGLQGITVTCDHFFTSYALVQELLKRKVALVGTIRRNKPELPSKLLQVRQRAALSSLFGFTKNTTAVSYIPKRGRNVLLLSSKHRDPAVTEEEKRKPVIIADYNHCKGAVDNLDKVVGSYSCRRMTHRWPQVLFHNMIDVSAFMHLCFLLLWIPPGSKPSPSGGGFSWRSWGDLWCLQKSCGESIHLVHRLLLP